MKPGSVRLEQYCQGVESGTVDVCEDIKLAVKRFRADVKKSTKRAFRWTFNSQLADDAVTFIELLPHTKGKWAAKKERIKLEPWQCFIVGNLFGWVDKKTGFRRFRQAYIKVPRKNGKSIIAAAIGHLGLSFDREAGAEVYSVATTETQAWEIFKPAKIMAEETPALRKHFGLTVWAKAITGSGGAIFKPLIGKPGDGQGPHVALIDEYHEHDSDHAVNTMQTGMGAREQPLLVIVTTAGQNVASACFEEEARCRSVLQGSFEDDRTFAAMYGIDPGDDWTSIKALKKANPNYGVSVFEDYLLAQLKQALQSAAKQNVFKTKHLNVWCFAKNALFNYEQVNSAMDRLLCIDDFIGLDCVQAADLATKLDLVAEKTVFRKEIDGKWHYYEFARYWLPEKQAEENERNKDNYQRWHSEGYLQLMDGWSIDYDLLDEQLIERAKQVNPLEFVFDPHNAIRLGQKIASHGFTSVEFTQTPANFTVPVDEVLSALADGRYHIAYNPITLWCFGNVVGRSARKGMMAPTKQNLHAKIDGAIASFMAMSRIAEPEIYQPAFVDLNE